MQPSRPEWRSTQYRRGPSCLRRPRHRDACDFRRQTFWGVNGRNLRPGSQGTFCRGGRSVRSRPRGPLRQRWSNPAKQAETTWTWLVCDERSANATVIRASNGVGIPGGAVNPNYSCLIRHCWIGCPIPKSAANATTPVSNPLRIPQRAWLMVPLLALAFTATTTVIRVRSIEYVSEVVGGPASAPGAAQARSPGSAWRPRLVIPGHHNESFEWLDQARQMFDHRQWRVRFIDYENAPAGREVFASCPYRWWLGMVALCHHGVTGAAMGPSLEWAALYTDPLLLLVFGAATVGLCRPTLRRLRGRARLGGSGDALSIRCGVPSGCSRRPRAGPGLRGVERASAPRRRRFGRARPTRAGAPGSGSSPAALREASGCG